MIDFSMNRTHTDGRSTVLRLLLLVFFFAGGWVVLSDYLSGTLNTIMALVLAPFIIRPAKHQTAYRYVWPALLVWGLYAIAPLKTLFFLGWAFAMLSIIEMYWGKTNWMALFLVLIASSFANYVFTTFGFEVRLLLSKASANVLGLVFESATSRGNDLLLNGSTYSVDPACIGLNSMTTSYFIALFALSYYEGKWRKKVTFRLFIVAMVLTTALIIIANFMRILALVLLKSSPDSFSHDAIGVFGLIVYISIPLILFIRWAVKKWAHPLIPAPYLSNPVNTLNALKTWVFTGLLALALGISFFIPAERVWNTAVLHPQDVHLYDKSIENFYVAKYSNDDLLIYIKPPVPFYSADHSPTICWRGSGYKMQHIREVHIEKRTYFVAELLKPGIRSEKNETTASDALDLHLFTAWWYDNGTDQTTNQWQWRWNSFKGSGNYHLINVTTDSEDKLFEFLQVRNNFM